jgi:putative restriction endonuclease
VNRPGPGAPSSRRVEPLVARFRQVVLLAEVDDRLRAAAFAYLDRQTQAGLTLVNQRDLAGFSFDGAPVRLMATQQGIWKPRFMEAALSIRTVFTADPSQAPYEDEVGLDGFLRYKWRGSDPQHPDNKALRRAVASGLPLIWFRGVASAAYHPIYPVYLVDEEPFAHQFVVALNEESGRLRDELANEDPALVRLYAERVVNTRLHQPLFRQRVLVAYANQCAICRLRHTRLLDAAHVLADAEGGAPVVTNGIAMCKIHHAAYDVDIFGISPDYQVGVRPDVLQEIDGPTLRYTLQAIDGSPIQLPTKKSARPDRDLLDTRWRRFRDAS